MEVDPAHVVMVQSRIAERRPQLELVSTEMFPSKAPPGFEHKDTEVETEQSR